MDYNNMRKSIDNMVTIKLKNIMLNPARRIRRLACLIIEVYNIKLYEPILLYQMGKVGSKSIYKSLIDSKINTIHIHHLKPSHLRQINKKKFVKIICPVRNPIDRHISDFFYNFELHTGCPYDISQFNLTTLLQFFLSLDVFRHPAPWFDKELKNKLGVDIYNYPFPKNKGYKIIKCDKYEILLFKLEICDNLIETLISDFVGLHHFVLTRRNSAKNKSYGEVYENFKKYITLPNKVINEMCDNKYTQHFYSKVEIATMRARYE